MMRKTTSVIIVKTVRPALSNCCQNFFNVLTPAPPRVVVFSVCPE